MDWNHDSPDNDVGEEIHAREEGEETAIKHIGGNPEESNELEEGAADDINANNARLGNSDSTVSPEPGEDSDSEGTVDRFVRDEDYLAGKKAKTLERDRAKKRATPESRMKDNQRRMAQRKGARGTGEVDEDETLGPVGLLEEGRLWWRWGGCFVM